MTKITVVKEIDIKFDISQEDEHEYRVYLYVDNSEIDNSYVKNEDNINDIKRELLISYMSVNNVDMDISDLGL